jgi:hypothetical protein
MPKTCRSLTSPRERGESLPPDLIGASTALSRGRVRGPFRAP